MNERTKHIDTRFGGNAADSLLQNEIDVLDDELQAEIERAKAEEKRLDEKIDAETERAISEEQRIEGKLDDEVARAKSEEKRIEDKLDDEIERAKAAEEALDNKIDAETERAQEAERVLDEKIDAESERAQEAERVLDEKIDKEIEDRIADVDEEEAARIAADEALDQKIDKEIQDRIDAVAQEKSEREAADAAEARAREDADIAEAAARVLGDEHLQDQIDAIEARTDVVDVVSCYDKDNYEEPKPETDLVHYDASVLSDNDVVKVLIDETHNDAVSYYRWIITSASGEPTEGEWVFVGSVEAYYTKSETDAIAAALQEQIDKDIEVINYSDYGTTTALSDELVAKAIAGKVAIYDSSSGGEVYLLASAWSGGLTFRNIYALSNSTGSLVPAVLDIYNHQITLDLNTKKFSGSSNIPSVIRNISNNFIEETVTPDASGKQLIRALNLRKTQDMIASVYDASSTYSVGDYCIYQNNLYRCISAIETAEAFTAAHWEQVKAAEVNNEKDILYLQSGDNLTDEQVALALRGKLIINVNGCALQPYQRNGNILYFKGFQYFMSYAASSPFNPLNENIDGFIYGDGSLNLTTKVFTTGTHPSVKYYPRVTDNLVIGSSITPSASGEQLIRSLNLRKAQDMMAPVYDSTATYEEGDYVIYQNDFYKCTSAITVAEAWNSAHWTKSSLSEMLDDIHTASELDILRLFREECTITANITNGSASGDSTIWTEETASVTIAADSGYDLPETITVVGASYTYDSTTGVVTLSEATGNVIITATCPTNVEMPNKGDIITLDGDSTKRYRVLKVDGTTVEVLGLDNTPTGIYSSGSTATFSDGSTSVKYADSTVDTYMNSTFYNSLSTNIKNAIVQKNVIQSKYDINASETSGFDFRISGNINNRWYKRAGQVSVGNRYCYALDIDDVAEYLGAGSGNTIQGSELYNMFSLSGNVWLASANDYSGVFIVRSDYNNLDNYYCMNNFASRPAFQVDISQLTWAKEE